ncbi:hypothetical protein [Streptomyces sp. NPDC048172]|uniref:hypothetical protein n=1 Tax=Streptomyces sp. NPDC048172 TaxID=3365505 RepID=UPI00371C99B4
MRDSMNKLARVCNGSKIESSAQQPAYISQLTVPEYGDQATTRLLRKPARHLHAAVLAAGKR